MNAPALAAADVGVAMGCGADISREAADICLVSDDLNRLVWTCESVATNPARDSAESGLDPGL